MKINFDRILKKIDLKIKKCFKFFENRIKLTIFLLFLASLIIRLCLTKYGQILWGDSYSYLLKSLEIAKGNFIPTKPSIGWPLFMAVFFKFFASFSIFQNMFYARIISNIVGACIIFPLALIGKRILNKKTLIILLVLFTFYSSLIYSSTTAISEPLFIFLLTFCIYFIIKSLDNEKYILIATIFASLSYYVKPSGLFMLPIIITSYLLFKWKGAYKNKNYLKYSIIIILLFFLVSAPFLIQREHYFGSAFTYGEADKYLLDSYAQVSAYNTPNISLIEYLKTHNIADYFNKFFVKGFLRVIFDSFHGENSYTYSDVVSPLLIIFFLYGFLLHFRKIEYIPLIVFSIIFMLSLSFIYSVFASPRYILSIISFILIFSALGIFEISKKVKYNNLFLALFLLVFAVFSLVTPVGSAFLGNKITMTDWGIWASENVQGKIAIIMGGDLIMMNLPDTMVAGKDIETLYAPDSNLSTIRPGLFNNLAEAMISFKEMNVTHLAVDDIMIEKKPYYAYLKESYKEGKTPGYLKEVFSNYNSNDPNSYWKMRIFEINWTAFSEN